MAVKVHFAVKFARRLPDPIYPGADRHIFVVRAENVPEGLPKTPNPRAQQIDRGIYRQVRESLLNDDGTPNTFFHKNKGITAVADKVVRLDDDNYEVFFEDDDGIVDGGHTYEIVQAAKAEIADRNEAETDVVTQFLKVEVLTGVPDDLLVEIAGGLNTAVQVQQMSLANLEGKFDWIKDLVDNKPYAKKIAFRQGEPDREADVRDVLVLMDLFNVEEFPNDDGSYPIRAYSSKEKVLENYLKNPERYQKLGPILCDILELADTISATARVKHNEAGGRGGKLAFVEQRQRGAYSFPYIGKQSQYRLTKGALFPILGAFRWMVEIDPVSGEAHWRGGFRGVLEMWDKLAGEMMRATKATSDELGRNPNSIGKSRNHWANLHSTVAKTQLMASAK